MHITVADYGVRRLNKVLNEAKRGSPEDIKEPIRSDVKRVLSDFLELNGSPKVEIVENGDSFDIIIKANADRIKPIGVIPK